MSIDVRSAPATRSKPDCCEPQLVPWIDLERTEALAALCRVLSDPIRVQIIDVLRGHSGEVCQCELAPLFSVSQPTLSHHLATLERAGLIEVERRGRWAYYSLVPDSLEVLQRWLS